MAGGYIKIFGRRRDGGQKEAMVGYHLFGIRIVYPFQGKREPFLVDGTYLDSSPYSGKYRNILGLGDFVGNRLHPIWSELEVSKEDIARTWSFGRTMSSKTGAPGRPSAMSYILAEFDNRCAGGVLKSTLTAEGTHLSEWLKKAHPHEPRTTATKIANKIRKQFKGHKTPKI